MRIHDLIIENTEPVEEGPILNKIGAGIGKAVGTAAKGVGAVAGGVAGLGSAVKTGYQAGKNYVAGAGDDATGTAPASTTAPSATAQSATAPATSTPGTTPQPAAAPSLYNQVKTNINQLDAKGKQRILALLQKQLGSAQAAKPAAAPAGGAMAQMANQLNPTSSTGGTVTRLPTSRTHVANPNNPNRTTTSESVIFHSKFLDKKI
jgi:hypothetical protein